MRKSILFAVLLIMMISISGQNPYLELTFTSVNNSEYVKLDSIKIMNRTQNCDTVLRSPDTLLLLGTEFGTNEYIEVEKGLQVFQNYPNPVINQTTIQVYVPEKDKVTIVIIDVLGRVIAKTEMEMDRGMHSFSYTPSSTGISFFTTQWKDVTSSISIISSTSQSPDANSLEYIGGEPYESFLKVDVALQNFNFSFGDTLLYIGYFNTLESGILDAPETNETFTFQFATNIPCPETPTVTYQGQIYNTVLIFNQCWLKENLNVGTMIPGGQDMQDNSIIEKHCYNNESDSCAKFGGLYQWNEMMHYTTHQGVQGICPQGWHLPTDEDWKILEGAVDSLYGIGDQLWDISGANGYNAGRNLKTTSGWRWERNGPDLYGFSGLPGGYSDEYGSFFSGITHLGYWWSSTEDDTYNPFSWSHSFSSGFPGVGRMDSYHWDGYSVRCLRDE